MLDQKLIRENPKFIQDSLSLRGKIFNIDYVSKLAIEKKFIDTEISNLQSESKKLSKIIGQEIRNKIDYKPEEINKLKDQGNKFRTKISELEEKKRSLDQLLQEEISRLPNLPSEDTPFGENESNNVQIEKWGDPLKNDNIKTHWEIGENLNLFDSTRSTKISKSRFITLTGRGARLERALINYMLDVHTNNGYLELIPVNFQNFQMKALNV